MLFSLSPLLRRLLIAVGFVSLCCLPLLIPLFRYAAGNSLFSHIFLIPFVSAYFVGLRREVIVETDSAHRWLGVVPLGLGIAALFIYLARPSSEFQDQMALAGAVSVTFIWAASLFTLGGRNVAKLLFPFLLLVAMVPFPVAVEAKIETFLQYGSAEVAYWMFQAAGTTLYREGLVFNLPGISMQVAPECSGIRSSLVLFITSLVGGQLFLRSAVNRTVLSLFVIPLALVRNGFRVFVLGELCVRVGPHMIDSAIHHQGGPIFFALSLIPFFALVWLLMRIEKRRLSGPKNLVPSGSSSRGSRA